MLKRFDEVKHRFEIPTQICVLGHITTQIEAVKNGAPADMIFQSIAGSEKGNRDFGFSPETVEEAMAQGVDRDTALAPFLEDACFEGWLAEFNRALAQAALS